MSRPEERLLRALPKVDVHCHLDGSLRVSTILDLARRMKVKLPADNESDLRRYVVSGPECGSLTECLDTFRHIYPVLREAASVERAAYEVVEDCAAENIRHVEIRFAPKLQAHERFSVPSVIEAALSGLERGLKDHGVSSGAIICLYRGESPSANREAFEAARTFFRPENGLSRPGVVGLDLAGDESAHPSMEFSDLFEEAARAGMPATCHAGETEGTDNLRAALEMGVRRIGHGTRLVDDEELLRETVRRGIAVEVGITSNVRTKTVPDAFSHPVRRLHEAGLPVLLTTDDRGIFDIDLTHELALAAELGFSVEELTRMSVEAVDHLFLPEDDRRKLKAGFESEISQLDKAVERLAR